MMLLRRSLRFPISWVALSCFSAMIALGCAPDSTPTPAVGEPAVDEPADAAQPAPTGETSTMATCPAPRSAGEGRHRAGLVVTFADGTTDAFCVAFDDTEIDAYSLLRHSPIEVVAETYSSPMGVGICRLAGTASDGCSYPDEACFCASDPVRFWTIWQRREDAWAFSMTGAAQTVARDGEVLGFRWGEGEAGGSPPDCDFAALCSTGDQAGDQASDSASP